MLKVVEGYAIIWLVIAVGYILGKRNLLGEGAQPMLGRLAFWVTGPAIMFQMLSTADLKAVFGAPLTIAATSSAIAWAIMFAWFRARRRPADEAVIGALTGSYANVGNLGLPFAAFVLGSPSYLVAPMIFQFVLLQPLTVILMDTTAPGRSRNPLRVIVQLLLNPMIWGTILGIVISLARIDLPDVITEPVHLLAAAQVPVLLLGFGISLVGARLFGARAGRTDIVAASIMKIVGMPLIAWLMTLAMGLDAEATFIIVSLAALPSAQNVFVTATRYGVATAHARQTVLLTTVASAPIMIGLAGLLT
ncbi:AEC family transporter [Falsarthrobacter nasiphocae]|uniref:Permease n=1 Tax=Falsarthrobacter nasiphocae TaxID=189863 RepID=A0AAE3YHA4_9MICC|nr:AEC family transporter [Falsarthrobacter nasiphocae]MDR6892272.1 putative permease [Falsarthrobacter nasiphocae]